MSRVLAQQIVHRGDRRERREIGFHILRTYPQMTPITQIKSSFMFLERKDNFLFICDI